MKKFRNGLALLAVVFIAIQLVLFDFSDLSWSANKGTYFGVIAMVLLIISAVASNRHEEKNERTK